MRAIVGFVFWSSLGFGISYGPLIWAHMLKVVSHGVLVG